MTREDDDHLRHDYRAEFCAANLIEEQTKADEIIIAPVGQFKRGYHHDVLHVESREAATGKKNTYFEICRDGLYDYLPEALFHEPHVIETRKNFRKSVENAKRKEQEELEARKFFLALEREFYRQRALLELEERHSLKFFYEPDLNDIFQEFWGGISGSLNAKQVSLLYLLPLSYRFGGRLDFVSKCFTVVLGVEVSISRGDPTTHASEYSPILDGITLGVDFVLGGLVNDAVPAIELVVGPLSREPLKKFLPGAEGLALLKKLCDFFLPADLDLKMSFTVSEELDEFTLSDEELTGRLGYTSSL